MDVKSNEEQKVLLVKEEGNDKMKVVTGMDESGKLKTTEPKKENEPDFMKLDKFGNILENFMSNFMRQVKDPTHFGFFKVPVDNIENNAQVLSEMAQSGDAGKEFLKSYEVDTSEFKPKQEQSATSAYQAIDESRIDWGQLEKLGVSKETLVKTNSLDAMLNWRKSPVLINISPKFDDISIYTQARLSFKEGADGKLNVAVHALQKEPQLDKPYYGNTFSDEDKRNLKNNGNLGRLTELKIPNVDKPILAYISVDKLTNELVALHADKVKIPNEIKGVLLNDEQKKILSEGKPLYLEGMIAKTGKSFNATVQVNADKKGLEFQFRNTPKQENTQNKEQKQSYVPKQGTGVRIPNKLGGVDLSSKEQSTLKEGGVIYIQGMVDKKGQTYNAYVKVNSEKEKLDFFRWNPTKKQGVTPDNNSKIQVAVNSEGKTNEATKYNKEPLKQEQEQPKEFQKKNKGMKM